MIDLPAAHSYAMPPKTVGLTFDDGPDGQWAPQVLAVLTKHHVPGTFFVIGSSVARHPELTRRIRAGGSEVGVHTFTHPALRTVSPGGVDREIADTQIALAGALDRLIPAMQAQGYRLTTITAGMNPPPANVAADPSDLTLGRVTLFASTTARTRHIRTLEMGVRWRVGRAPSRSPADGFGLVAGEREFG